MTSSSSCARAADILDLDRYMRSSVRPSHHHTRDRLVVDAGGADRVPLPCSSAESLRSPRAREHAKRYSHDSGLSDESYVKRRHRPHRRISDSKRESTRGGSNSSVLEFRAACEQALRDQQEQIARVAELCQKLVQPQVTTNHILPNNIPPFVPNIAQNNVSNVTNVPNIPPQPTTNVETNRPIFTTNQQSQISSNFDQNPNLIQERTQPYTGHSYVNQQQTDLNQNITKQNFSQNVNERITTDSSDASSTSRSSKELRRKEKVRSDSCKTYKIIMNKLDELNHLFATRRAQPPVVPRSIVARRSPGSRPSSECVSVCNKLVATDDFCARRNLNSPIIQVVHTRINRGLSEGHSAFHSSGRTGPAGSRPHEMDIAPDASCGSESDVHSQGIGALGEGWNETAQDYDLDNPLRLYAQAKRLQTLHASTRRTTRSNRSPDKLDDELGKELGSRLSLCALCRGYWRALRRCLTQQLFGAYS